MKPAMRNFSISSLMALCFSSSKRRSLCFTSLEVDLMFRSCSVTSLGMPSMYEGFHAKMSTSALAYLAESDVPMRTVLSSDPFG